MRIMGLLRWCLSPGMVQIKMELKVFSDLMNINVSRRSRSKFITPTWILNNCDVRE